MPDSDLSPARDYRSAGVDIDAGNALVERIKTLAARTQRPEVLAGPGGFAGLFELSGYRHPVLVAGADGVGTKVKLGLQAGRLRGLGIDLVAMCVNDVLVCGAEPLFFLDYYATGKLDAAAAAELIDGVSDGCRQAGAALLGGETAEMPGLYAGADFDLAGFCVGAVEKDRLIDGSGVSAGDALLALAASGPHANGFSLIRRLLADSGTSLDQACGSVTLGDALLEPTRIYAKALDRLGAGLRPKALAHVTGGGITDNLPRVLPDGLGARVDLSSWRRPALFSWLQQAGNIAEAELLRTFNCGIGMLVCVADDDAETALRLLADAGETAWRVGDIVPLAPGAAPVQYFGSAVL